MNCLVCLIALAFIGQEVGPAGGDAGASALQGPAATNSVDWSADGQTLLTGNARGDLYLFDAETGELRRTIAGGDAFAPFAVFSPDESFIAATDYAGRLSIYDAATGDLLARKRGHTAETTCVDVHPDGKLIATADKDGDVVIWQWDGVELKESRRIDDAVSDFANQVAFSPDGRRVAASGAESRDDGTGVVAVYDVGTGEDVMRAVTPAFANCIEFGPDGKSIHVGTAVGKVRGFEVATGGPIGQDPADVEVVANDITLVIDGDRVTGVVASGGDGMLRRAAFDQGLVWTTRSNDRVCYYAALSPAGDRVATSGSDGKLRIFDTAGNLLRTIEE